MSSNNSCVAIYATHLAAERAVKELQSCGIEMQTISIIGRDYHTEEQVHGYYNADKRIMFWGKGGAFWGSLWGLLFGSAFFFIPGVGPVAFAGPIVSALISALEGAIVFGGLSAIGAALYSIGIPKDSIVSYEKAIKADKFVVMVQGSSEQTRTARICLEGTAELETLDAHQSVA